MKIRVRVRPGALIEKIERISEGEYMVSLKERAEDGKANIRLRNILAKNFGVSARQINIKNPKSREKIIEVKK